jgi:C_GCAxxG_C_C family probable redox protein
MLAVGEYLLGDVDDRLCRMMTGIAGGLGGSHEELCGALNAGALLVGALHGRTRPDEADELCYELAAGYRARFIQEWGTTRCEDLRALGYGGDGPMPCAALVRRAAALLLEVLDDKA